MIRVLVVLFTVVRYLFRRRSDLEAQSPRAPPPGLGPSAPARAAPRPATSRRSHLLDRREAGDGHRLASPRRPLVLAVEEPTMLRPDRHGPVPVVFIALSLARRRVLHGNVTRTPRLRGVRSRRFIGSLRRECLDHVIALDGRHLLRIVRSYAAYYNRTRTHLSLGKDPPEPRPVQSADAGNIVAIPEVGGLHHRYERRMAA